MKHLGDCELIPVETPEGWGVCPDCDPNGHKPIPLEMHRNCRNQIAVKQKRRRRIEDDIASDIGGDTRTAEEIGRTLDKCFDGCKHMREYCRRFGAQYLQENYQAWIEHLLEHDCDPE